MITDYFYSIAYLFFIALAIIFNYYYQVNFQKFYKKTSKFYFIENDSPLFVIFPYERKIIKFISDLYVADMLLFFVGYLILVSKLENDYLTIESAYYFLILSIFFTLVVLLNYYRVLHKEKKALSIQNSSTNFEKNIFVPVPSNIVIYRKLGYISLLISKIFILLAFYNKVGL